MFYRNINQQEMPLKPMFRQVACLSQGKKKTFLLVFPSVIEVRSQETRHAETYSSERYLLHRRAQVVWLKHWFQQYHLLSSFHPFKRASFSSPSPLLDFVNYCAVFKELEKISCVKQIRCKLDVSTPYCRFSNAITQRNHNSAQRPCLRTAESSSL